MCVGPHVAMAYLSRKKYAITMFVWLNVISEGRPWSSTWVLFDKGQANIDLIGLDRYQELISVWQVWVETRYVAVYGNIRHGSRGF